MKRLLFPLCLAATACSGSSGKMGVGYIRITDQTGPCNVPIDQYGDPQVPTDVDYRRVHATGSFEGGSQWPGGNLVVVAYQDADGSVGRIYFDIPPIRGFGTSLVPNNTYQQGVGFVIWKDGVRTFAATKAVGVINYGSDATTGTSGPASPGMFFAHLGFDGTGPNGEALCELVALHAAPDHDRFESYDPTWLVPDPTALIIDGPQKVAPTFAGDVAPSAKLISPDAAPKDPGGAAPQMLPRASVHFGPGGDDGVGDCD